MTSCNASSLLQVQHNMSGSSSVLDGRKNLAPSLASSSTADMPNVSLDSEDGLGTVGALSPEKDKARRLQEVKGRQHDAELVSVVEEKEQTGRLASLEDVVATKADIYCVLEQERCTAAQTRQELALEQERSAEMAASIQRLEKEKMEVTAAAEKQKQEHESNLSRMMVVVEGLQEQTDRLAGIEAELRATEQSLSGVSVELDVARGQVERLHEEQEGGRRPGGAWKRAGRSWWGRWRSSGRGWGRRPLPGRRSRAER